MESQKGESDRKQARLDPAKPGAEHHGAKKRNKGLKIVLGLQPSCDEERHCHGQNRRPVMHEHGPFEPPKRIRRHMRA